MMEEAWTQLEAYVENGDQEAFRALLESHLPMVYSTAYRQLGDAAAAEEVAQAVFILLARKAADLRPRGSLAGWLYRAACLKAKKHRSKERARERRERNVCMENSDASRESAVDWERMAPLLDKAMASLSEDERSAVVLRFFQRRPLREVGASLGISEEAARKRVARGVEHLRHWFRQRGLECSAVALTAALATRAVESLPAGLTATSVHAAVAEAGVVPGTTSFLAGALSTKGVFAMAFLLSATVPFSWPYLFRQPEPISSAEPVSDPGPPAELTVPGAPASGLIAEWEALMANHGPADGSLAEVYEAIAEITDDFRRRAFRGALIAEWMARAPEQALAYLRDKDSGRVIYALRSWLETDPKGAIAAMAADPEQLKRSIGALLEEVAEMRPEAVPDLAQHVEKRNSWTHQVRDAFAVLAAKDPDAALQKAMTLDGPQKGEALAGVAKGWAKIDGEAALAWAQALDDDREEKGWVLRSLLVGWAEVDPAAALERIHLAPPGGAAIEFANDTGGQVLRAAAKSDFEGTLAWIGENPGKLSRESLGALSEELGSRLRGDVASTLDFLRDHPAAADTLPALSSQLLNEGYAEKDAVWAWLSRQEPSSFVDETRMTLLRSAAWKEPEVAMRWMDEVENLIDEQDRERLLSSMFNGGRNLPAVEEALENAAPKWRQEVLALAYPFLGYEAPGPIEVWIERLDELSPPQRIEATSHVARRMAGTDPAQAIAWADSLTDAEQSMSALNAAVKEWAGLDSYECSQWVADLEAGPQRDRAATALVETILEAEPDSAWSWATTIEDPNLRGPALRKAYRLLQARDPQSANALLADPALTPDDAAALLAE